MRCEGWAEGSRPSVCKCLFCLLSENLLICINHNALYVCRIFHAMLSRKTCAIYEVMASAQLVVIPTKGLTPVIHPRLSCISDQPMSVYAVSFVPQLSQLTEVGAWTTVARSKRKLSNPKAKLTRFIFLLVQCPALIGALVCWDTNRPISRALWIRYPLANL